MKPFNLRVLIADDHPAVRIGIESTLRESQAVTVVGAARDSTEMMEMLKQHDCQILVSDYAMPGGLHGDGIALFALVRQRYPRLKIVVMTMLDNPGIIHSLLDIGVPCILNKADSVSHLLPAVHAAYASGRYLSPSMAEIAARTAPHRTDTQPHAMLSKRELEVVHHGVHGRRVVRAAGAGGVDGGNEVRHRIRFAHDAADATGHQRVQHRRVVEHGHHHDLRVGKAPLHQLEQRHAVAELAGRHRVVGHQHVAGRGLQQRHEPGRIGHRCGMLVALREVAPEAVHHQQVVAPVLYRLDKAMAAARHVHAGNAGVAHEGGQREAGAFDLVDHERVSDHGEPWRGKRMFCIFPGAAKIPHRPSPKLAADSVGLRLTPVATQQLLPILSKTASGGTMRGIESTDIPPHFACRKGASMAGPSPTLTRGTTSLDKTLKKSEQVAADVQRASDNLAVVSTVLEQELPDEVQVGEVAQAIEHTSQLEEKLAQSAEKLAEVNAALSEEIEKRLEVTAERDESQALAERLKARIRTQATSDKR
ncbi:response regulator [Variovorax boronicumulans]|uniref:response regulator n=1 Tax=Variovorax boronicumulans TaxID=436515 RepID=UPI0036F1DDAF